MLLADATSKVKAVLDNLAVEAVEAMAVAVAAGVVVADPVALAEVVVSNAVDSC